MSIIKEIQQEIREVQKEPSSRELTILALLFLAIPSLIGGYQLWWKGSTSGYIWIGVGVGLAVCRLIPPLFRFIFRMWVSFSVILGYFVSRILLSIIFVVVMMPTGLLMRLFGKDSMDRKWDPEATTYWIPREQEPEPTIERYEKQF